MRVHISVNWSDLNITTRKGEGERRTTSRREGKVIAGVAACAVGAMTSLLLLVIMYTHRHTHRTMDKTTNLVISSNVNYVHLAEIKIIQQRCTAFKMQIQCLPIVQRMTLMNDFRTSLTISWHAHIVHRNMTNIETEPKTYIPKINPNWLAYDNK